MSVPAHPGDRIAASPKGGPIGKPARVPVSTYRLQLHPGFTFDDAADVVPYLHRLGVTDCYSSPYLAANPGSTHGYDICDHSRLNPELGGEAGYERWTSALSAAGMGHILDFVPNHMGINPRCNRWWRDVLENGPSSPFARYFDIDWDPVKDELHNRVLLPILGDQYGQALERGELQLALVEGALELRYFDHGLPINPRQTPRVFRDGLPELARSMGEGDPDLLEFLSIMTELQNLPAYTEREPGRMIERQREKEVARHRLARLAAHAPAIRAYVDTCLRQINGEAGRPASFDALHDLLEAQAYRLASWRTAFDEINYRRFFDVNDLAGLRMEDPEVFQATHALILRLIGQGRITGLRIDHPDGLFDPARYFRELQSASHAALAAAGRQGRALFVVAEKVCSAGERLPEDWAVHGTTGYGFLNDLNGLFVDSAKVARLGRVFSRVSGRPASPAEVVYTSKRVIMLTSMASELNVLAHALNRLSERDRRSRDFTLNSLRRALIEVVACFPIYRTYVASDGPSDADLAAIDTAIAGARRQSAVVSPSILDFIRRMLSASGPDEAGPDAGVSRADRLAFAMKFQQYSGPVQAKGLEDTAFYRHGVLLSANEVGGDPARMGRSPAEFHDANRDRLARWPYELLSTTTHDTKRGEDARARLNVLSEVPDEWSRQVSVWMRLNAGARRTVDGEPAPDRGDEYLFYQSLVGVWPAEPGDAPLPVSVPEIVVSRLKGFMTKAMREAKLHSSWVSENATYERATLDYVEQVLSGPRAARFLRVFVPFARRVAGHGVANSLAQLALKLTSPGVPDFYQGSELWDTSLVDPDNRRPVDYALRRQMLEEMEPLLLAAEASLEPGPDPGVVELPGAARRPGAAELPGDAEQSGAVALPGAVAGMLSAWHDGRIKLFVTALGLRLRRRCPDLFLCGDYTALTPHPAGDAHVVAHARTHGASTLVVIVPRLTTGLLAGTEALLPVGAGVWKERSVVLPAALKGQDFRNLITGQIVRPFEAGGVAQIAVAQALETSPVALLWGRRGE